MHKSLVSFLTRTPTLSVLLAALLVAGGFMYPDLWLLTIFGTGIYFFTLLQPTTKWKRSVILGALFGSITSGASIGWFWHTLPLTWIGIPDGPIQYVVIAVTWVTTTLALTLPHLILAPLVVVLRERISILLIGTLLWPVLEWARMLTFALWVLAPQSVLDSYFSIAGFGNSLAESSHLLQFASLGGVYVLHAVFGALSAAVALLLVSLHHSRQTLLSSVGAIIVIVAIPFLLNVPTPETTSTVRVALVSLSLPAGTPPDPMRPVRALSMLSAQQHLDVVVLPEGYRLELTKNVDAYRKLFKDKDILFITSGYVAENEQTGFGSLIFESIKSGVVGSHNKTVLVPLGEYLPPALAFLYAFFDAGTLDSYFAIHEEQHTLNGEELAPVVYNNVAYGALLCSEILSPQSYRTLTNKGADVLINAANNAWFHGSPLLYQKTIQLAKIHAVYNRKFFLTASNESPSFVIDPKGNVVAESAWGSEIPLIYDVPIER